MRCPKCSREFDCNAVYCETCSAMLEPFEREEETSRKEQAPHDSASGKQSGMISSGQFDSEMIDDVKIDSMKADIETKFVTTLLLEIEQLRGRLVRREKAHDSSSRGLADNSAVGSGEATVDEILKRIHKLEAILENLRKKIEADIMKIEGHARGLERPGLFRFLDEQAKYRRMLFSELETKKILLGIIQRTHPSSYFRNRELRKIAAGISIAVLLSLIFAWGYFRSVRTTDVSHIAPNAVPATVPVPDTASRSGQSGISEKAVRQLLDDIRSANLKKNIDLWASRYTKDHLGDRRDGILDQWKKYDYTALEYQIDDLKIEGDSATAIIAWEIGLFEKKTGWTKTTRQRLQSTFTIEDGSLKISSVSKQ